MKEYDYDLKAEHSAIIFERDSKAKNSNSCFEEGTVIGTSEWAWIDEDDARRICAALKYFSETETEEIERLANLRFHKE